MIDNRFERLSEALGYKSIRQFAHSIGISPQVLYDFGCGKVKRVNPTIPARILAFHPNVSREWIMTGEGDMYVESSQTVGNNSSGVVINGENRINNSTIDNRHYYSDSPDVLRAQIDLLDERIKEKDAQIKEKDAQIKEKDAQIKQLLDILAKR